MCENVCEYISGEGKLFFFLFRNTTDNLFTTGIDNYAKKIDSNKEEGETLEPWTYHSYPLSEEIRWFHRWIFFSFSHIVFNFILVKFYNNFLAGRFHYFWRLYKEIEDITDSMIQYWSGNLVKSGNVIHYARHYAWTIQVKKSFIKSNIIKSIKVEFSFLKINKKHRTSTLIQKINLSHMILS